MFYFLHDSTDDFNAEIAQKLVAIEHFDHLLVMTMVMPRLIVTLLIILMTMTMTIDDDTGNDDIMQWRLMLLVTMMTISMKKK